MSATDRAAIEGWVAAYRRAWASDDPTDIAALFTEEATYSPAPFAKTWRGRDAIVEEWIRRGDSGAEWAFEHEVLAADGPVGVIRGLTAYAATDKTPETVYSNIWIVNLAGDGRASSFAEWWMQRPERQS
jgi:ketosteroid isomerase-like protein